MDMRKIDRKESHASIVDDMLQAWLANWSGLRLYIRQRNGGHPADATMDRLLSEVLRTILPEGMDIARVVRFILAPSANPAQRAPGSGGTVTVHG